MDDNPTKGLPTTRTTRRIALLLAAGAALFTTAALPAVQAPAAPRAACPRTFGLCLDDGRVLTEATPAIKPPATGAVNNDVRGWCVFEGPNFTGAGFGLEPGDRVSGSEFRSAEPC
ncbi:hypothetical protein ACFQ6N_37405 [Kitasatospora sp. NPDC056446]|uniref:hypothetical protein n=1 Tax=Kitasatospora sp. NPDC056446 TaxID=3345819 RepID=UPI0036ABD82B